MREWNRAMIYRQTIVHFAERCRGGGEAARGGYLKDKPAIVPFACISMELSGRWRNSPPGRETRRI